MQTLTRRELTRTKTGTVVQWLADDGAVGIQLDKSYQRVLAYIVPADKVPKDMPRSDELPVSISKVAKALLLEIDCAHPVRLGQTNETTAGRPPEAWLVPSAWAERLGI